MKKWLTSLKIITPVIAILLMAVLVPVADGHGRKWSGADPILEIRGDQFNVRIEMPEEYTCDVDSIEIRVGVHKDAGNSAKLIAESSADFDGCHVQTNTEIVEVKDLGKYEIRFLALVESDEKFDVVLKVDWEGVWVREYEGKSNEIITGLTIDMKKDEKTLKKGDTDPILVNSEEYEELLQYTFDHHDAGELDKKFNGKDKKFKNKDLKKYFGHPDSHKK